MRTLVFGALLVVAVGASGAAAAGSPIRANYEVVIENDGGRWAAASSADIVSGRPIEHELGQYRLALTPVVEASGAYTLEVSIGLLPTVPGAIHVPGSESFQGTLGYPMEFEAVRGNASVRGAIMVDHVGS